MVTRKDIAEKAGVSISVVSRALNNSGYVKAEKKEKILKIAREMDYHSNPVAMSLMSKKTKQLLYYCKDKRNAYNIEVYEGMLEAAQKQGYMVMMNGSMNFQDVRNIMVDGLILPNEWVLEQYLKQAGKNYYLPAVAATYGDRKSPERSIPIIDCDLWKGMEMVLEYLWERRHRRIAMISPYSFNQKSARVLAWKEFMKFELCDHLEEYYFGISRFDLKMDQRVMEIPEEKEQSGMLSQENFFEKGELAAEIFAERRCDATAAVCFNDEMAIGFCRKIQKLGYHVPEDVSVMGIDGTFARRYADKRLTSLVTNAETHGRKCVEVLLDMINGRKTKYATGIDVWIDEGETILDLRTHYPGGQKR